MNELSGAERTVLHYAGGDDDRGGVISVVRALASAGRFTCVLGVNPGFQQRRPPPTLATWPLPRVAGEALGLRTFWRTREVARAVRAWLAAEPGRIFHGHSRAGLAVALWLARAGEKRVAVSVHCYGRQRWFYRWAARQLGGRLFWLTPAMRSYYGAEGDAWEQCIPGCVPDGEFAIRSARPDCARRPVRFGGIGMLVEWKRWHLVLQALTRLPPAVRAFVRFTHIGGPDDSASSRRYASALRAETTARGLDEIVEWRGAQPSSRSLLAEIDCLVIVSHQEPFSVAMLEALAAGVPVLAADSGGARDILVPPRNGWLFQSGEADDLARAIKMLVENDAVAAAQIEPQQLRPFMASVVAEQWVQVYDALAVRS